MRQKAPETFAERLGGGRGGGRRAGPPPPTERAAEPHREAPRAAAVHHASEKAVEKQHAKGKYTARERIEKLLDPGSFQELDTYVRHRTYDFDMQKNRPGGAGGGT